MRRAGRARVGGAGLAAIGAVVLLASGCGYGKVATAGTHADVHNGQALFSSTCGGCHTLSDAGTNGSMFAEILLNWLVGMTFPGNALRVAVAPEPVS